MCRILTFLIVIVFVIVPMLVGCAETVVQLPGAQQLKQQTLNLDMEELEPTPALSPEDVVEIQVTALQNNDTNDVGIEVTFRFASPTNKINTGPLPRFKQLVKNPTYRPMLNHKLAEYEPIEIDGDSATQRVTIIEQNGEATLYLFKLSRQDSDQCDGCWMTDSVSVIPTRQQELQQI